MKMTVTAPFLSCFHFSLSYLLFQLLSCRLLFSITFTFYSFYYVFLTFFYPLSFLIFFFLSSILGFSVSFFSLSLSSPWFYFIHFFLLSFICFVLLFIFILFCFFLPSSLISLLCSLFPLSSFL